MAIPEDDISILIPTYRYRDKVVRAVDSALASGAGEVVVVDDCGRDGTIERLQRYSDPRLKVHENTHNLGLWENHLQALGMATRPWIKFIQADDYLLPEGLRAYAAGAADGVTIVFGVPTVRDDLTGDVSYFHNLVRPRRIATEDLQQACVYAGWLLGSPSHMLLRSDAIEQDAAAWRTAVSSDLVVGSIAASRGDTVLLPAGAIGQGAHPLQDAKTQHAQLALERVARSLSYLRRRSELGLRRLANIWTGLAFRSAVKTAARGILCREGSAASTAMLPVSLLADLSYQDWQEVLRNRKLLADASAFRRASRAPIDLDELLDRIC